MVHGHRLVGEQCQPGSASASRPRPFGSSCAAQVYQQCDAEAVASLFEKTATSMRAAPRSWSSTTPNAGGGWRALSQALALCEAIEELAGFVPMQAAEVEGMPPSAPTLEKLFLQQVSLGELGIVAVGEALKSGKVPQLQVLTLANNALGESGGVVVGEALKSRKVSQLQTLALHNNALGESGGVAAGEAALKSGKVPQLQQLFLGNNALGESGGVAVGEALKSGKVPQLQTLALDDNALGESGGVAVGEALKSGKVSQLQTLGLHNNALGESGGVAVGEALKSGKVPQLQRLILTAMRWAMALLQHSPQPSAPTHCPTSHSWNWRGTTM